jgi:hypothetical protein
MTPLAPCYKTGVDTYDPANFRKHKSPDGWGSLCPDGMDLADARELFASSVRVGSFQCRGGLGLPGARALARYLARASHPLVETAC